MSVYVDPSRWPFGRMVMCHMWADSEDELLAMADMIGVARKWVQRPPKASWVHFDIAKAKRALAVKYGAIETDEFGPVEHKAAACGNQKMIDLITEKRARRRAESAI